MTHRPPRRLPGAELQSHGDQAVVTPHVLASQAGISILSRGGNAVDAAVAANAVLGVVAPETCGIGGDLFALVHAPGSRPTALNASGRAGTGASSATIRAEGHETIPVRSKWSITIPGCLDGWEALLARYGNLDLAACLAPAIEHAVEGFAVSPEMASALSRLATVLDGQPPAAALYPDAQPPKPGHILTRVDLAKTLTDIAAQGRNAFYAGSVGNEIVEATDGVIHQSDLEQRQADWTEPLALDVMGWTGWTIPPNSQGYLTLAAAKVFEMLDPSRDPGNPELFHAAIEAYRAVAWERDDFVADQSYVPVAVESLLDPARLEPRAKRISMMERTAWPISPPAPGGTAYLCVRDASGMGVSLIQSNFHGIGSGIGVASAGFFLHDRGSGFTLEPGHPNEIAAGKRPLHTLSPTLWTQHDSLAMLLGTRGGHFQPQTLLQMFAYIGWCGVDPSEAQRLPRWTTQLRAGSEVLAHEPHLAQAVTGGLLARGHRVEATDGWMSGWGPVSAITGTNGKVHGTADPRVASTAALAN